MNLNLKNPLVFFDLETTGTSTSFDKIVEYSFIKMMPGGEIINKTSRVNPGIPIPIESSLIHGIYDKDVQNEPLFKDVAKELAQFLEGCDLGGYNVLKFDVPVLVEEFLRVGVEFDISKRKIIDAQKIFFLMEKRTLAAAYEFYCGKKLDNAHSAEADTMATMEVFKSQLAKYDGQPVIDMKGEELGHIKNDMEVIHELTTDKMVDLAGRFVFNDQGVEVFNFGKFKGVPVADVLEKETGYYDWMMKGDFPLDTKRKLTQIKLRKFNSK